MFCAQCGQRLADATKFCPHCGTAVAASADAVREPPRPAPEPGSTQAAPRTATAESNASGSGAGSGAAFDAAEAEALARGIYARVKAILLSPASEWPVIAAEASSPRAIYLRYVAPLVAIGVIATFLGHTIIGMPVPLLGTIRVGIVAALAHAIVTFALSFLGVFLISLIVDALAPTFGGRKDPLSALKVTAYSYTPAWVAGVLNLVPALGVLVVLAAFYGLYLLYLGLPVLMRSPGDKAVGYTVVTVLCAIVMWIVIGSLSALVVGGLGYSAGGALGRHGIDERARASDQAAGILSNLFGGKSDTERERVSQAVQALEKMGEQAQQREKSAGGAGTVDAGAALNAIGQIMSGGKDVQPVDFHKLKDMLPDGLPGMQRTEASGQSGEAMGMKGSSATARYTDGAGASIHIEIADLGSLSGLAALAGKFDPSIEKETDTGFERTRRVDGQLVHERYDRRSRSGEVAIFVGNRFSVTVEGSDVEAGALTTALKRVDVSKLAVLTASAR